MNDDKPFVCHVENCRMRFINEDHLNVHSKKHEMSLALSSGGLSSSSPAHHFLDQTPTPTKFLKNNEEITLFQEFSQNPFDHAYKKALDNDPPIPGPQTNELNTPTLILSDSLKNSANIAGNAFLSSMEKIKGSEPLKPSPLAKTSVASKILLDLSGKSVMTTHLSSSAARRNMNSQIENSTSTMSPVMGHLTSVETAASLASQTISSSYLASQTEPSHHSTTSLAGLQHHILSRSTSEDSEIQSAELIKQEVIKREIAGVSDIGRNFPEHQQCTMQVLLQLPNGETVPISIPATINKFQYMGGTQIIQQPQLQQQAVIQQQSSPLQPASSKTVASNITTTLALKQRLKAQLQNQLSPTAKAADVTMALSNPTMIAASTATPSSISGQVLLGSTSPIMMVDSPSSEMNFSDSSDYSIDSKHQRMSPEIGDPEERRRKFLERNRAAAARCRQKRKHWISNLERKADDLQGTNVRLQSEVKLLRGEVAQLKTLLLAHKECPVTQQQRSQRQLQHIILTDPSLTSQELAQVVPTADMISEPLQLGQTFVTFLRESVLSHQEDLETSSE